MNKFQSNSSTNIQIPFYLYHDPFMEPAGEPLRLWVYHEPWKLFAVTTYTGHDISRLKQKIAAELQIVSTSEMFLWKVMLSHRSFRHFEADSLLIDQRSNICLPSHKE